jgi:hypothetical protein
LPLVSDSPAHSHCSTSKSEHALQREGSHLYMQYKQVAPSNWRPLASGHLAAPLCLDPEAACSWPLHPLALHTHAHAVRTVSSEPVRTSILGVTHANAMRTFSTMLGMVDMCQHARQQLVTQHRCVQVRSIQASMYVGQHASQSEHMATNDALTRRCASAAMVTQQPTHERCAGPRKGKNRKPCGSGGLCSYSARTHHRMLRLGRRHSLQKLPVCPSAMEGSCSQH